MAFSMARKRGRRRFLMVLLGLGFCVPLARFARPARIRPQDFVRRDGWILRRDDLS